MNRLLASQPYACEAAPTGAAAEAAEEGAAAVRELAQPAKRSRLEPPPVAAAESGSVSAERQLRPPAAEPLPLPPRSLPLCKPQTAPRRMRNAQAPLPFLKSLE